MIVWRYPKLILVCVLVLISSALGPSTAVQSASALTLPQGFEDKTVVSGLLSPRDFVFTPDPDNRLLIAVRGNKTSEDSNFASIRVFQNGGLQPYPAQYFNMCGGGERGFLGMALDPQFTTNHYVYVYYTSQAATGPACGFNLAEAGPRNRVSRVTLNNDNSVSDERILLDNMPADSGIHNSGGLHFGLDGNLYITAGDGGIVPSPAQSLGSLGGKMLRIRPTSDGSYTLPSDNPFANDAQGRLCGVRGAPVANSKCKEIYAYGLRNAFRFTIQPGTSTPFAFDVGGGAWEEVDKIVAGGNYGHPVREGPCPGGVVCDPATSLPSGYADPIYWYKHEVLNANNDSAIIGGAFYTGTAYPPEYQNGLFFAEFVKGWIRQITYNSAQNTWNATTFATGGNGIIGIRTGKDNNLYYLTIPDDNAGEIHKIAFTNATNQAPVAKLSVDVTGGPLSTTYAFSGAGSYDPDGNQIASYQWDFGDGTTFINSSPTATHTYNTAGAKTVSLTVYDNGTPLGTSTPATLSVYPANTPPTGTIELTNITDPTRQDRYYANDVWQFKAINLIDDATPANALVTSWRVVFHHREHTHPFLSHTEGRSGQFTVPPIGETDPVVWYRVYLTIQDNEGQQTEVTRDLFPKTVTTTFATNPPGGSVTMDGKVLSATFGITRVVGMEVPFEAPMTRTINGKTYTFGDWTDLAGASAGTFCTDANELPEANCRIVAVPPLGETYLATYAAPSDPSTTTPSDPSTTTTPSDPSTTTTPSDPSTTITPSDPSTTITPSKSSYTLFIPLTSR